MNTLRNFLGVLALLAFTTVPVAAFAVTDTAQPVTSATLTGTMGGDGWYTTSVTVTLSASDGVGGSGVAKTEYSLDNVTWQTYSAPFILDKDGDQFLYFRSTDLSGNVELPAKSQEIKINQTGLVGLWHMDNDWKDASVVGNNGTPYNGVTFGSNSKVGTFAGSFDGSNDYVDIPWNITLQPLGSIAVSAWVYPYDVTTYHQIVTKRYADGSDPYNSYMLSSTGEGVNNKWRFCVSNGIAGSQTCLSAPDTIIANQWSHVAGTYDGTNLSIYVNGVLKATTPKTGQLRYSSLKLRIGTSVPSTGQFFKGLIDEVSIYNHAMSAGDIQSLYRKFVVKSPSVNPVASPTTSTSIILGGTKPSTTGIAVNGNTLVPVDGMTTWQSSYTLSQGINAISVTAVDSQNRNSLPVSLTVVLDSTPPLVTTTTPLNYGIYKAAPSAVSFTLADTISPLDFTAILNGATVTNASGYKIAGVWSTSGSGTTGSITFTPSAVLSDGQYTATIKPTDALGNGSTNTLTFTIDSTPPVTPGIDPVSTPISTTSKTVTGTRSSDSASVAVSCAGAIESISYPTATTWSAYISGLKEGSNTITAYAVDEAGNRSGVASAMITVDTTPPVVGATVAGGVYNSTQTVALAANEPAVIYYTMDGSTPTANATLYSQPISIPASATVRYFARDLAGNNSDIKIESYVIDTTPPELAISTLSDGAYTNNEILNIAGRVTDNSEVKEVTVNGTAVQMNADGTFSYALLLKNGLNIITTAAADSVGNMAADTRTVTLDQAAPVLAVTTPADNSKTGKAILELSGTVDETSAVTIKMNDLIQSAVMNGGTFTATILLEPGYNTIEITAADLAGNRSTVKRTVVFDDQVPSLAVIMPNQDLRTNQSSVTIKGMVADVLTAVGVTIRMDNEIFTPPVVGGAFEQVLNLAEEKTYGIVVSAMNEVGTSATVQRNVIYDITPPVLSIDPVSSPTSQRSVSVAGTREAGTAVIVTCATANVGDVSYPTQATWQAVISSLREGENEIVASSADAAGNAVTATATVVLASRPPQITIRATPDVIWPPSRTMVPVTIAGGLEANGYDVKSVSISVRDEYGKYEYNNLTFGSTVMLEAWRNGNDADGRKYTITAIVTDRWGNTTSKTAVVTVPHDKSK